MCTCLNVAAGVTAGEVVGSAMDAGPSDAHSADAAGNALAAIQLNDWENHRTDSSYEANMITKAFVFQFINSYGSCFYIAFLKESQAALPHTCTRSGYLSYIHDQGFKNDSIEALGGCKTPDALALWLLWCRNRVQVPTGVSVGSAEMWECLYRSHFEEDSSHVCAQIVRDLIPPTPPTATIRIVIVLYWSDSFE